MTVSAGQRFAHLLTLAAARYNEQVEVECDCGKRKHVNERNLRRGITTSCGCARKAPRAKASREPANDTAPPRFIPASFWRTPRQLLGAALIAVWDGPMLGTELCTRLGVEADDESLAVLRGFVGSEWLGDDWIVYRREEASVVVRGMRETVGEGRIAA